MTAGPAAVWLDCAVCTSNLVALSLACYMLATWCTFNHSRLVKLFNLMYSTKYTNQMVSIKLPNCFEKSINT